MIKLLFLVSSDDDDDVLSLLQYLKPNTLMQKFDHLVY